MKTVFDIETQPLPIDQIAHLCPPFTAPSNYKDADKIAANIAEQRTAWIDRAALSPVTGSICAIGYLTGSVTSIVTIADGLTEKDLIEQFWDIYGTPDTVPTFVGHNIAGFDVPFIIRRSWFHGLRVPMETLFPQGRYLNDRRFVDTMKTFQCGNAREDFISLDRLAKFMGLAGKTEDIGKDFGKILASDANRAIAYLTQDLNSTRAVAERMGIL